jgi:trimethylamine-N-oxide reductase (cytochrome c)
MMQDVAENCELVYVWCGDIENNYWLRSRAGGLWHRFCSKDLGIPYVGICPEYNLGQSLYCSKWIPIIPQMDGPVFLAIAYTWLTEGTYDQAYLDTHSVGFELWKPYVLGEEDGVPKTPAWAAPLCGITEWTIKAMARQWTDKKTSILHALGCGGMARGPYAANLVRLQNYLLGMQGGMGSQGQASDAYSLHGFRLADKSPVVSSYRADSKIAAAMRTATVRDFR